MRRKMSCRVDLHLAAAHDWKLGQENERMEISCMIEPIISIYKL
jgi:hypothetical protein